MDFTRARFRYAGKLSIICCCRICRALSYGDGLGNSEAIKHAVRHGLGISCLSRRVIAEQLRAGPLGEVAVPLPRTVRTLWRVHHRRNIFLTRCSVF